MSRHRANLLLSILLPILLAGSLTPTAHAFLRRHAQNGNARDQIASLEEQWRTATLTGDASLMDRLLSEDYVGISWNGQLNTKSTQLDHLRKRTLSVTRIDVSDVKIKLAGAGTVAIVTSRATVEGTSNGIDLKGEYRYTRVYQRLPSGAWKITSFEATRIPNRDLSLRAEHSPAA